MCYYAIVQSAKCALETVTIWAALGSFVAYALFQYSNLSMGIIGKILKDRSLTSLSENFSVYL